MTEAWTKGPWIAEPPLCEANLWAVHAPSDDSDICYVTLGGERLEANARLIAAAPDGYAVVSRFRRKLETYVSVYPGDKELRSLLADCDAFLAKVDGGARRPPGPPDPPRPPAWRVA